MFIRRSSFLRIEEEIIDLRREVGLLHNENIEIKNTLWMMLNSPACKIGDLTNDNIVTAITIVKKGDLYVRYGYDVFNPRTGVTYKDLGETCIKVK